MIKIHLSKIYLKSNMDRFIVLTTMQFMQLIIDLKSNMDRFIEYPTCTATHLDVNLKSNMDRFIEIRIVRSKFAKII